MVEEMAPNHPSECERRKEGIRIREVRVVKRVEHFRPELEPHRSLTGKILKKLRSALVKPGP